MERCIHEEVCQYKTDGEENRCSNVAICKHFDDGSLGSPEPQRRKASTKRASSKHFDDDVAGKKIGEKEFKRARLTIATYEKMGKLNDNQKLALETLKGKHFKGMSEIQKQQVLDIAKDLQSGKAAVVGEE